MHSFRVALLVFGLAAVTLQASGKPQKSEHSYQLFHKQRASRGRRTHDDAGTGRIISQNLINRFTALKYPTTTTTAATTTTTTYTPTSPTTPTIPTPPTTLTPPPPPPSPTSPSPSPSPSPTKPASRAAARKRINIQGFAVNPADYDEEIDDEGDDFNLTALRGNNYENDSLEFNEDDADEQSDNDNAIAITDEHKSAEEFGRAATRARPSNWRRRQALRRYRQRLNKRRRQVQRQRRRRLQQRLKQQQKRKRRNRNQRRKGTKKRIAGRRRRIVRIAV